MADASAPTADLETERAVLDCILSAPAQLEAVRRHLDAQAFYVEPHRLIYREMLGLHDTGQGIDVLTVQAALERHQRPVDGRSWAEVLGSILNSAPLWQNAVQYADRVAELGHQRRLGGLARALAAQPDDPAVRSRLAEALQAAPLVNGARRHLDLRPAAGYSRRQVRWLAGYEGFFPLGMLSLLVGYQGDGKTLIVCLMAANETRHGRRVVIATTEDEVESVMRPRLEAAGADLELVSFVVLVTPSGEDDLYLPDHGDLLVDAVEEARPSLFVIDPMEAFLGASVDSWKAPSVRLALRPISTAAQRAGCAAVVVGYINRGVSAKFLERVAESMAFSRASRSAVLLWRDPEDPDGPRGASRVLALGKTNLAPAGTQGRAYRIEPTVLPYVPADPAQGVYEELEQVTTAKIVFTGYRETSADELLEQTKAQAAAGLGLSAQALAEKVLQAALFDGRELPAKKVEELAEQVGVSLRTMQRALKALGGETYKTSVTGGWVWRLACAGAGADAQEA